eukprot:454608-Prymnesium_polylepis.1
MVRCAKELRACGLLIELTRGAESDGRARREAAICRVAYHGGLWPMVCRKAVSSATRALRCL